MKQQQRTEITVARIVEAAIEEFGSRGYSGGSVNNICAAGINKGLIYHNFKDKDQLYLECLRTSCSRLTEYVHEQGADCDLIRYMNARMDFFTEYPREAHIFFEALLNPQITLKDEIDLAMKEFNTLNEKIYSRTVKSLELREGVTFDEALSYFRQMQIMFNGYFSSPAYRDETLEEKIKIHEAGIPKLFEFMLYGVAEGGKR